MTVDPERDTPEVLAKLAAAHGVDASRWRFLRTDAATVPLLAATRGVRYHKLNSGRSETAPLLAAIDGAR